MRHDFGWNKVVESFPVYELGSNQPIMLKGVDRFMPRCSCGWLGQEESCIEDANVAWKDLHLRLVWDAEKIKARDVEERRRTQERKDAILAKFIGV